MVARVENPRRINLEHKERGIVGKRGESGRKYKIGRENRRASQSRRERRESKTGNKAIDDLSGRRARIDRTAPCETRGRRKSDGGAAAVQRNASRRAVGRPDERSASRQNRVARISPDTDDPGAFYSLVCEEYLFGQLAVEHLVRVPEAPGHGVPDERFLVQKRHFDG